MARPVTALTFSPRRSVAAAALAAAALLLVGCAPWRMWTAAKLASQAKPYSARPADPVRRILVVGDSTAVGTGASAPLASLPGLMGQAHPAWQIDNLADNGARFADVAVQLDRAAAGYYDMVLVLAGGNDVIRFTPQDALRSQIAATVAKARQKARRVVLMPCGNVGHAPIFMQPLSWVMAHRSERLHAMVQEIAAIGQVRYVRLLKPRSEDPFVARSDALHAADGLHPSDAGYQQWWRELIAQNGLAEPDQ